MSGEPLPPHLPRESWEAWLADRLDGSARRRIEDHLSECAECTAWIARTDPSHLFHRLRAPVPDPAWDGFWDGIERGIGSPPRRRRPMLMAVAGLAATLALMALVASLVRTPQPAGIAADSTREKADPCAQATLAAMSVTRPITEEECRLLHGGMTVDETPLVIRDGVDLRGL